MDSPPGVVASNLGPEAMGPGSSPSITDRERAAVAAYLDLAVAAKGQALLSSLDVAAGAGVRLRRTARILGEMERAPNGIRISKWSYPDSTRWLVKRV